MAHESKIGELVPREKSLKTMTDSGAHTVDSRAELENFPRDERRGRDTWNTASIRGREESGERGQHWSPRVGNGDKSSAGVVGQRPIQRDFFLLIIKDVSRDRQFSPPPRRTVIRVTRADKFSYYARLHRCNPFRSPSSIVYSYVRVYVYAHGTSVHISRTYTRERRRRTVVERSETTVNHFCESRV